ncbi:hypothetical protein EDD22DRAFT_953159 [Suillus occidentalis]|nr:hypothetical protein EDD22DRAFT_953159 [Suillus occidentalis]
MADSQAWQSNFGHQHLFDQDSTSSHGIQPQPQAGLGLTAPGSDDSDTHIDQASGFHRDHAEYPPPPWEVLTHGSGHTSFNSDASLSQPWQSVRAQFGGSDRPIPPSLPAAVAVAGACITSSVVPNGRITKLGICSLITATAASTGAIWRLEPRAGSPLTTAVAGTCPTVGPIELGAPPITVAMAAGAGAATPLSFDSQPLRPSFSMSDTHDSEPPIDSSQDNIDALEKLGHAKSLHASHKRASSAGTRRAAKLPPDQLKSLKDSAQIEMVQKVFETGLFPGTDELAAMANAAIDVVVASDATLKRWRPLQESRQLTSRLKGVVKTIHSDFQKVAPIITLTSHRSLAELLMTQEDMLALQAARISDLCFIGTATHDYADPLRGDIDVHYSTGIQRFS